ncbi:hypothetical protein EON63_09270 [archaeon]|nr:MAG: hypothetical protein EON63_09270 [archaeon]
MICCPHHDGTKGLLSSNKRMMSLACSQDISQLARPSLMTPEERAPPHAPSGVALAGILKSDKHIAI